MESLPIINKLYEIYKRIIDLNETVPKRESYSLGISLENSVLETLENLILAKNAPKPFKAAYLIKASSQLEITTLKLRLLLELKLANETKIFQIQGFLTETGRMLGGWLRATQNT
ncbi:four helix bundle protein [Candidatus Peregrinibacteria bacterium]|nr:four helix bundle protein [Candidatus Peregrinibacteria bacterium]